MPEDASPPLARVAFDRAADRRGDSAFLEAAWADARVLLVTPKSATPTTDDPPRRLAFAEPTDVPQDAHRRFLGLVDGVAYFAATVEPDDTRTWSTLRDLGAEIDDVEGALFATAIALEQWHQRHPHCPVCGAPTVESTAGWTRTCERDGSQHFPRTDPAVIMLIHDGRERALLGRSPQWPAGRYSTLAGFVEPGESLEAAVAREVFEEVGVQVRDIRYVASQPWPFPSSLMVGFSGRLDGAEHLRIDPQEIAEAGWFDRDEVRRAVRWTDEGAEPDPSARLRGISPRLSISRYLVDRWLDGTLPS